MVFGVKMLASSFIETGQYFDLKKNNYNFHIFFLF
jgi:hypothetical protein